MEERSLLVRVVRRLAFALVFGIIVGSLLHVLRCARYYYWGSALYPSTRPDGSRVGFIEYAIHADPYLGIGTLVIAFTIALWLGPREWMGES